MVHVRQPEAQSATACRHEISHPVNRIKELSVNCLEGLGSLASHHITIHQNRSIYHDISTQVLAHVGFVDVYNQ